MTRPNAKVTKRAFVVAVLVLCSCMSAVLYKRIILKRGCTGRLKRAADANTIDVAKAELGAALDYIKRNRLDHGHTSVLYTMPDEDVGFWAMNLRTALKDLESVPATATLLERSNVLMKLRETILDDRRESGVSVTVPPGLPWFPNNLVGHAVRLLGMLALVASVLLASHGLRIG